jgi:hypothetical protein
MRKLFSMSHGSASDRMTRRVAQVCAVGSRRSRLTLAVLLGCLALLLTASGALAGTAKISGTVTSAVTSKGIGHIEVVVYSTTNTGDIIGTAATEESGNYSVTVSAGTYKVGFKSSIEDPLNYVTQFYDAQGELSKATSLNILEGENKSGVDAQLQPGGSISGIVTDASTHQPLADIAVIAAEPGTESFETLQAVALTDAAGEYTLVGLPAGTSDVVFEQQTESAVLYSPQIYNGQSFEVTEDPALLFASATPVPVVQSKTTPGINAAMVREEPVNTIAPVLSGTPMVGHPLSCSTGSWTGIQPFAYAYAWLRNGVPIAGATTNIYVTQAADQGAVLLCEVTATNELQIKNEPHKISVGAVSNTLTVPAALVIAPPPPPVPVVVLSSSKITVSAGSAPVSLTCANASCTGTIELTAQTIVKQRKGKKTTSKKETVILGKGSYSLAAGHGTTIDVHLNAAGKSALAKAQHQRLPTKVRVFVTGGKTLEGTATLSEPQAVKRKPKHKLVPGGSALADSAQLSGPTLTGSGSVAPTARIAEASHAGWPTITGMLLQNSTNESRPLDGRPGHDPFDGTDPSYSCDGEDTGGTTHNCGYPGISDGPRFTTLTQLERECGQTATPQQRVPSENPAPETHPSEEGETAPYESGRVKSSLAAGPSGLMPPAMAFAALATVLPPGLPSSCAAKYEQTDLVPADIGHNELLGGHGNDTIHAGPAGDVIWGDSQAEGQPTSQVDRLYGGAGNDWIYASHGTNYIWTGAGEDHVLLVYGHGVVYCNGPGRKILVMRKLAANRHYRLVGCTDKTIDPYAA